MVKYEIVFRRIYLNSCHLSFPPDERQTFEGSLTLEPGVELSIWMRPKGNEAPDSPPQLTNICEIAIEGRFSVELPKLENLPPSDQLEQLNDQITHFRDRYKILMDSAVFFTSIAISPHLFYKLESETLTTSIGKLHRILLDREATEWYPSISGRINLRKFDVIFRNLNLLKQETANILVPLSKACHWYATAIKWKDPTDSFIAGFTGLEVILNTEKLPEVVEYRARLKGIENVIKSSECEIKNDLLDFIEKRKSSILQPPLRLRLETLLTRANSPNREEELQAFDEINRIRNELLHGRSIVIPNMPLVVFNPKPFANPLQSVLTLLKRCIFYALNSRIRSKVTS